jgi:thiol-disulfide isomerase/thioredoxin
LRRRTEWFLLLLAAVVIFSFHVKLKKAADPDQIRKISDEMQRSVEWQGKIAPDFQLPLRDGKTFVLADHIGKEVVILNFFATWCGPCRAEAPELNRYASAMRERPVILIGIDAREAAPEVDRYVHELKVPYPVGIDAGAIMQQYGVQSFPTTVIIDAQGRIALYETGAIMNADVSFGTIVDAQVSDLRRGGGIGREAYLEAAKNERYGALAANSDDDGPKLTGRAAKMAETMDCLCGCDDKLAKCTCSRATKMKKKLAESARDETKSDADIVTAINDEFCVRDQKEM